MNIIERTAEMDRMLTEARVCVSIATPLLAYNMFACEFHVTNDPQVETGGACVIGERNIVYIDEHFFTNILISPAERAFLILHEILHIFCFHQGRQVLMGYNHELWNIATDYYINLIAKGTYINQYGKVSVSERHNMYISLPTNFKVLYNEEYIGLSSDEIYHRLIEEHGSVEAAIKANGGGQRNGDPIGPGSPIDSVSTSEIDAKQAHRNIRTAAAAIAKGMADKTIGEGEGDLVRALNELFKPKLDWREQLNDFTINSQKEHITYNKISRRTDPDCDFIFPSKYGESVNIIYGIDSSGSMRHEDYFEAGSELKGILGQFDSWDMTLLSCDVKATVVGTYSSDDGDDFDSVKINLVGGAGTRMLPIIEYANERMEDGEDVNVCIVVTDGHIPTDGLEESFRDDCQYIFVVTSSGNKNLKLDGAKVIFMSDIGK